MPSEKIENRTARRERVRRKVQGSDTLPRLSVYRSLHHIYAQVISDQSARTLESVSTLSPDLRQALKSKANVSAAKATDPQEIRDLLVRQVTAMVRWRECVNAMVELGVDSFVELGTGKVLSGLIRRIAPDAATLSAATPAEVEAVLKSL